MINKSPEELLTYIYAKDEEKTPKEKETLADKVKKRIKYYFKADPSLVKTGVRIRVHGPDNDPFYCFAKIRSVLKTTDRVFITLDNDGETFSVSRNYLTGEKPAEFPYKKGDYVCFHGSEWEVIGINPASRSIAISREGDRRKVNMDRVTKLERTGDRRC